MKTVDQLRGELDTARANAQRLQVALDTANARYARYLTMQTAKGDLSMIDVDQLAAGVSLDAESCLVAIRELERRRKDALDRVNVVRQELYYAETQPAVDAYLQAVVDLTADFIDLAERIETAQELIERLKGADPRVFHIDRLRRELLATVTLFEQWRHPRPSVAGRLWRNDEGSVEAVSQEEFERREQKRLDALKPKQRAKFGVIPLGFGA